MKKRIIVLFIGIVFLFSFPNLIHAGKTRGLTDQTITIGSIMDLTGPASFIMRGTSAGAESYVKYINDQGGINGRKIRYIVEDNTYQPATAVAALKKLVYRDKIFALCLSGGTVCVLAMADAVKRDDVPTMCYSGSEAVYTPFRRHLFSAQTSNERYGIGVAEYIIKELKPKSPRFASIYQDDEFGKSGLRGFRKAAKFYGVEWVGEKPYKRGALDFTSQVISLKNAGANYVYLSSLIREGSGILREAKKLNWHPIFSGFSGMSLGKLFELAGDSADGFIGSRDVAGWEEDTPGVRKIKETIMKYRGNLEGMHSHTNVGWELTMLMTEGLKRAGKGLTTDNLIRALESIKNFDPDGLAAPVTWGRNRREGAIGLKLMKADVANKAFVPITGWIMPELKK